MRLRRLTDSVQCPLPSHPLHLLLYCLSAPLISFNWLEKRKFNNGSLVSFFECRPADAKPLPIHSNCRAQIKALLDHVQEPTCVMMP